MLRQQIWIEKNGPAHVLTMKDSACPPLGKEQVQVKVAFSGINFADIIMRLGFYPDAPKKPFVPGYEASGIVERVGFKVSGIKPGDKVFFVTRFEGYSSHLMVDQNQVMVLHPQADLDRAAALPVNFLTAYLALFEMGRTRPGDKVLIDCASGGVGNLAIQMAKNSGASVVGLTSSEKKKHLIQSLGAVALTHEEFLADKQNKDFDFILNSLGGASIKFHFSRLGTNGKIVCIGISSGITGRKNYFKILQAVWQMPKFSMLQLFNQNKGVFGLNVLHVMNNPQLVEKLKQEILKTKVEPLIGRIFAAKDVSFAHLCIENREVAGKVLLRWD
jgi:NADPH:quinone reductase-like Zn-dependent oxidoreductase